jgi:hypothetical protein
MGQIPKQRKLNEPGRKRITALLDLGLLVLGLQLVPLRPERAVVGVEHLGEEHLDMAEDVVGEVPVLLDHGDEELVPEVPDPEGELLVPGGDQRAARHPGLGPLLPQPRPGVGVPQPVAGGRPRASATRTTSLISSFAPKTRFWASSPPCVSNPNQPKTCN